MPDKQKVFTGPLARGWHGDVDARWRGWYVLISDKLYYDDKTKSFYDYDHNRVDPTQVRKRYKIDPFDPLGTTFSPSQAEGWLTPRTEAIKQWQVGGGERPQELVTQPTAIPQAEGQLLKEPKPVPGYTWSPMMDLEGNVVSWELVPERLPAGELSPYEQWQADFQQQQFAWQQGEAQRQLAGQQYVAASDWARLRQTAFEQTSTRGTLGSEARKAKAWETWNQWQLSQLDPNVDWIKIQELRQRKNPYDTRDATPKDRIMKWGTEIDRYSEKLKRGKAMIADAQKDETYGVPQSVKDYFSDARTGLRNAWQEFTKASTEYENTPSRWEQSKVGSEATGYSIGRGRSRDVQTPATPAWLAKMYPEMEERLPKKGEATPLAAPSAQAFMGLSPTQKTQWGAYAKYTGANPEDLLWQTERMLPQQPNIASRWAASKQRA